jgi:cathepsin L
MKFLTLFAIGVACASAATLGDSEYDALFTQFKLDHTKTYATAEEHASRLATFKANVDFIMGHNENADKHGYTVGINQFADMSATEFKKTMLTYQAARKTEQKNVKLLDETTAPASVDWVSKGAVTPVKNQGQCGSCWAFSTTGSVEGAYQIATGKLQSFSEQELVDCAGSYGNQGCNGGLMDDGFKYIEAKGDALESTYSYTGKTGTCNTAKQSNAAIKAKQLTTFSDVKSGSEPQMMAAVAQGPVSVAIEADQSGFQFYKSGVFSGTCGTNLDHGVLVVGYGTSSGSDYWKVKNSWGTTWGQDGYMLMARSGSSTTSRKLLGGGGGGGGARWRVRHPQAAFVPYHLRLRA